MPEAGSWVKGSVCVSLLLFGVFVRCLNAEEVRVRIVPADLFPGQPVLVRIQAGREIAGVRASLGDQRILFFADQDRREWTGLAGLDLEATPGEHRIVYTVNFTDGSKADGAYPLWVQSKEFPVERITVDEKFVHLSKKDLERFHREQKILESVFSVQSPMREWNGGFRAPVNGEKGSVFGLRRFINGEPRSPHAGEDLKAVLGTSVHASNAGRVAFTGDLFFSGKTVIVDHGAGLYSLYAHLNDVTVKNGRWVSGGDIVGHVGATGRATGPHLHWGIRLNRTRVDPESLVSLPFFVETDEARQPDSTEPDPTDKGTAFPTPGVPGSGPATEGR